MMVPSRTVIKCVDTALGRLSYGMTLLGAVGIGILAILLVADVSGRTFSDKPIDGTIEMVRASIIAVAFLTIPYAVRSGGHVRTNVLVQRMPGVLGAILNRMSYLLGAVLFLAIAWASWEPMVRAYKFGEFLGDGALRVPTSPTWTLVIFASVVAALECVSKVVTGETEEIVAGALYE